METKKEPCPRCRGIGGKFNTVVIGKIVSSVWYPCSFCGGSGKVKA